MSDNHKLPDPGSLYLNRDVSGRLSMVFFGAGAVGLLGTFAGALSEGTQKQALYSYLVAYFFVATLALGGLFFAILHHLVGAVWSVVVRRIAESMAATLPVIALLFIPLGLGIKIIYPWAGPAPHEAAKWTSYVNEPFFLLRAMVYLGAWGGLGWYYYRRSLEVDKSGDPMVLLGLRRLSAPAMLIFALSLTFAGFDWLMSLDPAWYSTIFGVYLFAGTVVTVMMSISAVALLLRRAGLLKDVITIEHYHDLGKLAFGFIVFWTYIGFSQYFLYWYGNIPEETEWFAHRWEGGWQTLSLILIFGCFAVPFFSLISRNAKRSPAIMGIVACILIPMHYVDLYWIAMPELHREGPAVSWLDITALVGLFGIFAGLFVRRLGAAPLVPAKDPLLPASMEFENA